MLSVSKKVGNLIGQRTMIIAFYPGGGGNRYRQFLVGNDWKKFKVSYDEANSDQLFKYRYLTELSYHNDLPHILTHCMNSGVIKKLFPNNPIVVIKADLQTCLRREWMLHGHKLFMNNKIKNTVPRLDHYNAIKDSQWPMVYTEDQIDQLPDTILQEVMTNYKKITRIDVPYNLLSLTQTLIDKINSAYEIVNWHFNYYQEKPVDFSQADTIIDIATGKDEFSLLMQQELELYPSEIFDQVWKVVVNE
jgi:hypothetical protein